MSPTFDLDLAPEELVLDSFAGGGGTSQGVEDALGRPVDFAFNHDQKALAMHRVNHPNTVHFCEDIWAVDIKKVVGDRRVGLAWFSPDCKHFSKAKGGKPVEKKIRGLAWVVLRWAGAVRPRVIILENVEEFKDWGPVLENGQPCKRRAGMTFKRWCTQLRNLGYTLDHREERASKHGAPTIRKRLFIVARCDGKPIVWPAPTHGNAEGLLPYRTAAECIDWTLPCPSIFLTKEQGRAVGVNRPLADATMDRIAKGVWKYVINSADPFIVNITHQGGDRSESTREPLRTVTAAKRGEKALVMPTLMHNNTNNVASSVDDPLKTVTTGNRHFLVAPHLAGVGGRMGQTPPRPVDLPYHTTTAKADTVVVAPLLTQYYGKNRPGGERTAPVDEALRTVTTENRHAVVAAFLAQHNTQRTGPNPGRKADTPLSTVTATGRQQAPVAVFLSRQFSNSIGSEISDPAPTVTAGGGGKSALTAASIMKMRGTNTGHAADSPLHTVSARGKHHAAVTARLVHVNEADFPPSAYLVAAFLMKYYGADQDPRLKEPLHTATTKDRFAVVIVTIRGEDYVIVDIGMRMLTPRELFRAQGFPESYIIDHGIRVQGENEAGDLFATEIPLTRTEQIRMCGNSVCPPMAKAIVRAQFQRERPRAAAA